MGKNSGNEIGALLGVGLGVAAGLRKRKERKKEEALKDKREAQGDTMFDLQKQQAELNLRVLNKSIEDAEAAGRVFTPEEKALFEEAKAQKAQELQDLDIQSKQLDVQKGTKDMASYDSDKALERQVKEANLGYMGAMTNRMNREPAGGSGGGEDGMSINLQRELSAMTAAAEAFKEVHFNEESGEWDNEQSFRQWQGMRKQFIDKVGGLTGVSMPSGTEAAGADAAPKAGELPGYPQKGLPKGKPISELGQYGSFFAPKNPNTREIPGNSYFQDPSSFLSIDQSNISGGNSSQQSGGDAPVLNEAVKKKLGLGAPSLLTIFGGQGLYR